MKIEESSEDSEFENQKTMCMEYAENKQEVVERIDEELYRIYKSYIKPFNYFRKKAPS